MDKCPTRFYYALVVIFASPHPHFHRFTVNTAKTTFGLVQRINHTKSCGRNKPYRPSISARIDLNDSRIDRCWLSAFITLSFDTAMTEPCTSPHEAASTMINMTPRNFMHRSGSSRRSLASSDDSTVILMNMMGKDDDDMLEASMPMSTTYHNLSQRSLGGEWMMGNAGPSQPMAPMEKLQHLSCRHLNSLNLNSIPMMDQSLTFSDYYGDDKQGNARINFQNSLSSYHPELEEESAEFSAHQANEDEEHNSPRTPIRFWEEREKVVDKNGELYEYVQPPTIHFSQSPDSKWVREKGPPTMATQSPPARTGSSTIPLSVPCSPPYTKEKMPALIIRPPQRTASPTMESMPPVIKPPQRSVSPTTISTLMTTSATSLSSPHPDSPIASVHQVVQVPSLPFSKDNDATERMTPVIVKPPQRTISPTASSSSSRSGGPTKVPGPGAADTFSEEGLTSPRPAGRRLGSSGKANTSIHNNTARRDNFLNYRPMSVARFEMAIDTIIRADEPPSQISMGGKQRRLSFGYVLHQGFDKTQPACEIVEGCLDRMDEWYTKDKDGKGEKGASSDASTASHRSTAKIPAATTKPRLLKSILKKVKRRLSGIAEKRGSFFGNKAVQKDAPKAPNRRGSFQPMSWMPSQVRRGSIFGSSSSSDGGDKSPSRPSRRRSGLGSAENDAEPRRRGSFLSGLWSGGGGGFDANAANPNVSSPAKPTRRRSWLNGNGNNTGDSKFSPPTRPVRKGSFAGASQSLPCAPLSQSQTEPEVVQTSNKAASLPDAPLSPQKPRRRTSWFGGNSSKHENESDDTQRTRRGSWFGNKSSKVSRQASSDETEITCSVVSSDEEMKKTTSQPSTTTTTATARQDLKADKEITARRFLFSSVNRRASFTVSTTTTTPVPALRRTHRVRSEASVRRLSLQW